MVLDTSAIVAIENARVVMVAAPTLFEAAMVLTSRTGCDARPVLTAFLNRIQPEVVAFNDKHFAAAAAAFSRFGKGRHPAGLNFGDCISYAIASVAGLPLLYSGEDFARTDIPPAV